MAASFESMHAHAVVLHKQGNAVDALAAYTAALEVLTRQHKTHRNQHVTLGNRARLLLSLGKPLQALEDARKAQALSRLAIERYVLAPVSAATVAPTKLSLLEQWPC